MWTRTECKINLTALFHFIRLLHCGIWNSYGYFCGSLILAKSPHPLAMLFERIVICGGSIQNIIDSREKIKWLNQKYCCIHGVEGVSAFKTCHWVYLNLYRNFSLFKYSMFKVTPSIVKYIMYTDSFTKYKMNYKW